MSVASPLETGRSAVARHDWHEAFDTLSQLDREAPLGVEDLDALAQAAWWIGKMRDCIAFRERAFVAAQDSGDVRHAMKIAAMLASHHGDLGEETISRAWLNRARKLMEEEPECAEAAHVKIYLSQGKFREGELEEAATLAEEAVELGTRHRDRDAMAFGLSMLGGAKVILGDPEGGMALLDEATIAAVSGELGPLATGMTFCVMISACSRLADYQRAGQWSEAARRWCERQSIAGFPGVCRVHHAEVLRLRGALADAEEQAKVATRELQDFSLESTAEAFHELGEIRLRAGDLSGAEEAFRQALEMGRDPQPGFAILQIRQGNPVAAMSSIERSLDWKPPGSPQRAKILPTYIEIALAAGELDRARSATAELQDAVKTYNSPAMRAGAAHAESVLALHENDPERAREAATRAVAGWRQVDLPYEAARCRVVLAEAYAGGGDVERARLELQTARAAFVRLGALPDVQDTEARLRALDTSGAVRRQVKTFLWTDIVNSTNLLAAMGDTAWASLLAWHDRTLRGRFTAHGGEEIKHTGDGFFVAFDDANAALACAIDVQRALAEHRQSAGFAPQVRIGLHAAEADRTSDDDFRGKGVHESARIGAIAEADEILASAGTVEGCGVRVTGEREVELKGFAEPIRVVSILWRD